MLLLSPGVKKLVQCIQHWYHANTYCTFSPRSSAPSKFTPNLLLKPSSKSCKHKVTHHILLLTHTLTIFHNTLSFSYIVLPPPPLPSDKSRLTDSSHFPPPHAIRLPPPPPHLPTYSHYRTPPPSPPTHTIRLLLFLHKLGGYPGCP